MKGFLILLVASVVVALPFIFERPQEAGEWKEGDPRLVIVTPHNEAIRHEFAKGFSDWHLRHFGTPVMIDWRMIGGTTEIMRYLNSEYRASAERLVARERQAGRTLTLDQAMDLDDPAAVSCGMDLFFGGGSYDHGRAGEQRLTVPAWPEGEEPPGLFSDARGRTLIPAENGGEVWRGRTFYGCVLSTFGICYNRDRLDDLGIGRPPATWRDLADPRYAGFLGLSDPTKSGSVAKAFEMMIHTVCAEYVARAGFPKERVKAVEEAHRVENRPFPEGYQEAVEAGWLEGLRLVRRIGANARYFTDSSGNVPVHVSAGVAAAGLAIDFYGRLQSELSPKRGGCPVMTFVTPVGGSSVSADPISLLRGAPSRRWALRFIEYVLGEEGQKLWNYRIGTPGGTDRFTLRRLPIRRDFYPSDDPDFKRRFESRRPHLSDPLWEPANNVYYLAESFHYEPRWTARHFGIQRDLIRAMCMDSGDELRAAWKAILSHGGPERQPEAMRLLEAFPSAPIPLNWRTALQGYSEMSRLDRLRVWTSFFRKQYTAARKAVR